MGYSLFTEYDELSDTYEVKLLVNNASFYGSQEEVAKSMHADNHPELTFLVESFLNALVEMAGDEKTGIADIAKAWEEAKDLKEERS